MPLDMLFDCFTWLLVAVQTKQREARPRREIDSLNCGNMVIGQATSFSCLFSLQFGEMDFLWAWVENAQALPKNFLIFSPYQITPTFIFSSIFSHLFSIHPISPPTKHSLSFFFIFIYFQINVLRSPATL